ncbi:tRNA guanosine(34) transglycosylase Tgt [Patescibacteria group bacterium]|nr:tRNA guanosine(34) transglycosylase Tgt [Patescibacteria group bacterium]
MKQKNKVIKYKNKKIETPFFMPDATRGFLKTLSNDEIIKTKTKAMVVNTFHLYLQPGMKVIKKAGGIHKFMNYSGFLLSDSGGFQVFSLIHKNPKMGKILEDKVVFKSPLNGSWHELSPEKSIQIQFDLGTDMMVCLDDCPPYSMSKIDLKKSIIRTTAWAKRCKLEYERQIKKRKIKNNQRPLLFAVIQGGKHMDLRTKSYKDLEKIGFDGFGFGARPVDEKGNFLSKVLKETAELIDDKYYKFALGIGTIEHIYLCEKMGWEIFDCVIPTREARHGRLFLPTKNILKPKVINISNSKYVNNFSVINRSSDIKLLKENSFAYLNHLFKLNEALGQKIASLNNLEYYQKLMFYLRDKK